MEIYLAIINTYLSIVFTILVIYLYTSKKDAKQIWDEITKDNEEWKKEVRKELYNIQDSLKLYK